MSISAVSQNYTSSATYQNLSGKQAGFVTGSSNNHKDSASISEAAKELAAQNSGATSKEEAAESVSTRIQEQLAGTD